MFYSYHNLQGSQTTTIFRHRSEWFYSYHNLQGSQTVPCLPVIVSSFTLIIIYKVLKLISLPILDAFGFYSYHNLQGSQTHHIRKTQ